MLEGRTERLASEFPEPADAYLCDNCKRDITEQFFPGQSHSWQPMSPQRYTCVCGRKYLTGSAEWAQLSDWERNRRISQTHGIGILLSIMLAVPAAIIHFLAVWLFHLKSTLLTLGVVIAAAFFLVEGFFWLAVAASKLRTR